MCMPGYSGPWWEKRKAGDEEEEEEEEGEKMKGEEGYLWNYGNDGKN